jgi:predicted methyltransferase
MALRATQIHEDTARLGRRAPSGCPLGPRSPLAPLPQRDGGVPRRLGGLPHHGASSMGRLGCTVFLLTLFAGLLHAQAAGEANSGLRTAHDREALAAGLSDPARDERQKPRELVQAMGLQRGMTVADVGTGVGYMLPFLSRAVGKRGRVIGEDIFQDFLNQARLHAGNLKLDNVTLVKGTETDPALPEGQVDQVLLLDTYHHFDYPEKMLAAIYRSLKPGGRLVVVDYYRSPTSMPGGRAMTHIRLDKPDAIREIEANLFRLLSERDHIPGSQYMLVLEKN